ncbi:helix-turn-helix domain-containing protein [Gordonia aichiensis]|uniref:helix-turn-helix domain-containing protein n=1 Tax=Gordonia aichiensis TaxID=36820 RepID=UPI00326452A8
MTAESLQPTAVTDWSLRLGLAPEDAPAALRGSGGLLEFNRRIALGRARSLDVSEFAAVLWRRRLSTMTVTSLLLTPLSMELGGGDVGGTGGDEVVVATVGTSMVIESADGHTEMHRPDQLIVFASGARHRLVTNGVAEVTALRMSFVEFGSARALLRNCGGLAVMDSFLAQTVARSIRGFGAGVIGAPPSESTAAAEFAILELLSAAAAEATARRTSASSSTQQVQRETQELIERHYRDPEFSPTAIADRLHLSRRQFYRHFENSDRGVAELIADRRLQAARTLLVSNPEASIASVARASGFGSLGPFRLRFRRAFGMGPNEFRDTMADAAAH